MQYLQQMNNQGIMGLPQVQQQPVVQRQEPGSIASGLRENITPSSFKRNQTGALNLNPYDPAHDLSGETRPGRPCHIHRR